MPVDAFVITALSHELNEYLHNSRIDKIHMPARDEVHILGRGQRGGFRLLMSAGSRNPRAHLSAQPRENPDKPPMFCMLLRKYLGNGRFAGIYQPHLERVLHFFWDSADELGVISRKTLICEMMGRNSNIILTGQDGRIIDSIRRVDSDMSAQRPVLPGLFYRDPPGQGKNDPTAITEQEFQVLLSLKPAEQPPEEWLLDTFSGLSPAVCRDLAAGDLQESFFCQVERIKRGELVPFLLSAAKGADVSALPLLNSRNTDAKPFEGSFSELLDVCCTNRELHDEIKRLVQEMLRQATSQCGKIKGKIAMQKKELLQAQGREALRENGDLLMANLHNIKKGQPTAQVEDFYSNGALREIALDPTRSPQQNAARFYKRYAKAKNAEAELKKQIKAGEREIIYWESVAEQLSRVQTKQELQEIKEELQPMHRRKGPPARLSEPYKFVSDEGISFRAGRNNRQNDELTMKSARKNDIWLHAQKIPGCHIVISVEGKEPQEETLVQAAAVAAYYSAAKNSPKVPVDYTLVKYVKKPQGSKPGFVTYERFKTILAQPDRDLAERLRVE
ncbi:MAG: NFACT family protein [Oscillospiraceae bacterium]|nr:NFACT family protein [Oscillospiraceae bacterium]